MQQMGRDREKNGDSNPRPNPLLEKQLEEILRNAERTHRRQLFWRRVRSMTQAAVTPRTRGQRGPSAGRLMALGLVVCVVGALIGQSIAWLSAVLLLAGAILFISPIFLSLARGGHMMGPEERLLRWRPVQYSRNDPFAGGRRWVQEMLRRMRGGPPPRNR
jgi:hypothetical protein